MSAEVFSDAAGGVNRVPSAYRARRPDGRGARHLANLADVKRISGRERPSY